MQQLIVCAILPSSILYYKEGVLMAVFLDDNLKNWLKNSTDYYFQVLQTKKISEENAIVYTLLVKTRDKSTFLESLYALANVKTTEQFVNEKSSNIKKNDRFRYFNKIRAHIERLTERFQNDFLHMGETLNISFLEIACLEIIYFPEQTQKLFDLSYEKYCQLAEALKEKILSEIRSPKNKNSAKAKEGGNSPIVI